MTAIGDEALRRIKGVYTMKVIDGCTILTKQLPNFVFEKKERKYQCKDVVINCTPRVVDGVLHINGTLHKYFNYGWPTDFYGNVKDMPMRFWKDNFYYNEETDLYIKDRTEKQGWWIFKKDVVVEKDVEYLRAGYYLQKSVENNMDIVTSNFRLITE